MENTITAETPAGY